MYDLCKICFLQLNDAQRQDNNMDPRSMHNLIIPGWMIFELKLNYSELRVYALIYGFSQGGQGDFHGSLKYLADWCGLSTRSNVLRVIRSLQDKQLIKCSKERIMSPSGRIYTLVHYTAVVPDLFRCVAKQQNTDNHYEYTPYSI